MLNLIGSYFGDLFVGRDRMWTSAFQKVWGKRKQLDLWPFKSWNTNNLHPDLLVNFHKTFLETKYHRSEIHLSVLLLYNSKHHSFHNTRQNLTNILHFRLSLVDTMATSAIQNPEVRSESKSAKKKKAKADAAAVASVTHVETATPAESTNGDGSYESPYIKELYK